MRPVLIVIAYALAGMLITLCVQAAGVLRPGPILHREHHWRRTTPSVVWPEPMPPEYQPYPVDRFFARRWGSTQEAWGGPWEGPNVGGCCRGLLRVSAGWPMRSAVARIYMRDPQAEYRGDGLRLETAGWHPWARTGLAPIVFIPIRPLWPGFAVNSLLYSAVIAGLLLGPHFARRAWRASRGRCLRCGYQLPPEGGRCPECGTLPSAGAA